MQLNYELIDNDYIARRILELSTGRYNAKEVCEIIGSERSLERILLEGDIQHYIEQFCKDGLIVILNDKLWLDDEKCLALQVHLKKTKGNGITRVLWDITRKCNLRCQHCYAYKDVDYSEELTLEEMYNTIDKLKRLRPYLIVYGGGEPFSRKDFIDILKRTKEVLNCRVKILTNGTMLTKEIVKEIKDYVDFIQISLDGTEQNHDNLRGKQGCFKKVIKAIQLVREEGIETGICMTISRYSVRDIEWVINYALEQGVYKLRISPFVASGKALNNFKDWIIPKEDLETLYNLLAEYRIKYTNRLLFDFRDELYGKAFLGCPGDKLDGNNQYMLCAAGRSLFYINPEGYITPCNFIDTEEYFAGNVKTDDLVHLWYSNKVFDKFRELKVDDIEKCSVCKRKATCGAGLRCNALMTSGSLNKVDPLCSFFEAM